MSKYQKNRRYQNQTNVLATIILGLFKAIWWLISLLFKKKKSHSGIGLAERQYIASKRDEIFKLSKSENIIELQHAVIEADKLVDYILRAKGYMGQSFADRLRQAEPYTPHHQYQALWQGHKIRNMIAHEDQKLDKDTLIQAINILLEYE